MSVQTWQLRVLSTTRDIKPGIPTSNDGSEMSVVYAQVHLGHHTNRPKKILDTKICVYNCIHIYIYYIYISICMLVKSDYATMYAYHRVSASACVYLSVLCAISRISCRTSK